MIKIKKNEDTKTVTRGAYETFYKPLGYMPAETESKKVVEGKPKTIHPKASKEKGTKKEGTLEDDLL